MKSSYISFLLLLIPLLWLSIESYGQISFAPMDTLEYYGGYYGSSYSEHDIADFDNDGILDLLYKTENKLLLRRGNGDGTFKNQVVLYSHSPIFEFSMFIDINNDGYLDVSIRQPESIVILFGDGQQLVAQNTLNIGEVGSNNYSGMVWHDVDNDSSYELLVGNYNEVLLVQDWETDEWFTEQLFEFSPQYITNYSLHDINKDDKIDIIGNTGDGLYVAMSTEENTYDEKLVKEWSIGNYNVGDINLDGYLDIIINERNDGYKTHSCIYDSQTNIFTLTDLTFDDDVTFNYEQILVDIDKNGSLDLILSASNGRFFIKENSNGIFQPSELILSNVEADNTIAAGDINNDTQIDLITLGYGGFEFFILDNSLNTTSKESQWTRPTPVDLVSGNLDNDNYTDIVTLSNYGQVFIHWGSNDLSSNSEATELDIQVGARKASILDMDHDGIKDIIFSESLKSGISNGLYVCKGLGERQFSTPTIWKNFDRVQKLQVEDLENDGIPEAFTYSYGNNTIYWFNSENSDVNEYYAATNFIELGGFDIVDMKITDINNDGLMDFLSILDSSEPIKVSIMKQDPSGNFIEEIISFDNNIQAIETSDYNNDGMSDLILVQEDANYNYFLNLYLLNANGDFELSQSISLPQIDTPRNINILDLDQDGDSDILIDAWDYLTTAIIENNKGVLSLYNNTTLNNLGQNYREYIDLNNDGKLDVASVTFTEGNFSIQLNNSVLEPSVEGLILETPKVEFNSVEVSIESSPNDHHLIIISESDELTSLVVDNQYYTSNTELGIGSEIGGGYIVMSSDETSIEVTGLLPSTTYYIYAFTYNLNQPQNSIINYSNEYVVKEFKTASSIFLITDLEGLSFEKDSNLSIDLDNYINNIGNTTYSLSAENENISFSNDGSTVVISSNNNYFGSNIAITINASNDLDETFETTFSLEITSVNDAPAIISQTESLILDFFVNTDPASQGFEIPTSILEIVDPDNSIEDMSLIIVDGQGYSVEDNKFFLNEPTSGILEVTVTANDGELDSEPFNVQVSIDVITSVNSDILNDNIQLWPNPVSEFMNLSISNSSIGQLELVIYDLSGKVKLRKHLTKNAERFEEKIDFDILPKGQYVIQIHLEGITTTQSVILK